MQANEDDPLPPPAAGSDDTTHQMSRDVLPTGELPELPKSSNDAVRPRIRPVRFTIKVVAVMSVVYFFVLPLLPDFRDAIDQLVEVQPVKKNKLLWKNFSAMWEVLRLQLVLIFILHGRGE